MTKAEELTIKMKDIQKQIDELTSRAGKMVYDLTQLSASEIESAPPALLNTLHETLITAQRIENLADTAQVQIRGLLVPAQAKTSVLDMLRGSLPNCGNPSCPIHGHMNRQPPPAN